LKRFANLRASVKMRYAEAIQYKDFEPKIQKLLDTHITATEVIRLNQAVNIFDEDAFKKVLDEQGAKTAAAKADTIAHATKRAISERLELDPAFYEKFSKLIQQTIDDFRAKRISDLEYLKNVSQIKESVVHRRDDDKPASIRGNDNVVAVYGLLKSFLEPHMQNGSRVDDICADAAVKIWSIFQNNWKVSFWDDLDAQRRTANEIDDYLYDEIKEGKGLPLTTEDMDGILDLAMRLAKNRMAIYG
jgi:type I restriction enzyme R subunit